MARAAPGLDFMELMKMQFMAKFADGSGQTSIKHMIGLTLWEQFNKNIPLIQAWIIDNFKKRTGRNLEDVMPILPNTTVPATIRAQITFERSANESDRKTKPDIRTESVINYVCSLPQVKSLLYCGVDYIPDFNERIPIDEDVYFKLEEYNRVQGESTRSTETIKFNLCTFNNDIQHLHRFIESAQAIFEQQQRNKLGNYTYYFDQQTSKTRGTFQNELPKDFCIYTKNRFNTNRTFDNVFFEQKKLVQERVKFFIERKDWYDSKGMPYTLGFMFHGAPGCGKTSTIKAIANITRRHIFNIQLSQIKTNNALKHLFYCDDVHVFDGQKTEILQIPVKQRLYVIEDIDAMKSVVIKRKPGVDPSEAVRDSTDDSREDIFSSRMKAANMSSMDPNMFMGGQTATTTGEKTNNSMDLATLLNVLDGTLEVPGRILAISTNFPEKLDNALIRPGRIDMVIEFKKCNRDILRQMIDSFYDRFTDPIVFEGRDDLDYKWTPAEINQILFRNFNDPNAAISELIAEDPRKMFKFSHINPEEEAINAKHNLTLLDDLAADVDRASGKELNSVDGNANFVLFNKKT